MSVTIEKGNLMRDDINRAVDTGMTRQRQLAEWRKILLAILSEFDGEPDSYVVVIQGERPPDSSLTFSKLLRLTLGQLRSMK